MIIVDGIVLMCRYGGDKWWWLRTVVEVGVLGPCSSLMVMYDDVVIHGVDCCDC